jgi:hypothetical protein
MVKTTVLLPGDLWEAAKIRALTQRTDLRSVVIEALEAHLRGKGERKGRKA